MWTATLLAVLLVNLAFALLYRLHKHLTTRRAQPRHPGTRTRLLIVLGSGGHTAEMLSMLSALPPARYTHRSYVVTAGDAFSARRAEAFEASLAQSAGRPATAPPKLHGELDAAGSFDVAVVPRARRVHQGLVAAVPDAVRCFASVLGVLQRPVTGPSSAVVQGEGEARRVVQLPPYGYPDLIVTNGPGTGVVVVAAALLVRIAGGAGAAGKLRTVYVESWARVGRLSLSGRLLLRVVDRFLVQWEGLVGATGGRAEFRGVLV